MNTKHVTIGRVTLVATLIALTLILVGTATAQADSSDAMASGHVALDKAQYRSAADHFRSAARRAESDKELAEAYYWRAFALSRLESRRDLQRAAQALLELNELQLDHEMVSDSRALAAQIKAELARQGDAQSARELAEMLEDDQDHEDMELKLAALQAMMHMNPERTLPVLTKILQDRDPQTVELRRQAIFLLSQGGAEGSEALMIDVARNDPDEEVREQAIFWLGQSGSDEALEFYVQLIRTEQDPDVIGHALFALSQMDSPEANDMLREIAADPRHDSDLRHQAIFGLGMNGSRSDRTFLRNLYSDLEDPEMQEAILHAVAQHDDPGTADWLVDIALDDDQDIESRKMALFWAGQQGLLPLERLDDLYLDIDDREMREQIIFVLSQDDSEEAVERLIRIARNETDFELRKQAIFWIGQSGAEGSEEFLLEIISE